MTRILIADPDAAGRKALNLLLRRKLGITDICEAGDTEALIRSLADCPPDLLLMDWKLYGAPAPETCHILRRAYPALRIVLLSVNADDEQVAQLAGAAFIHKGAAPGKVLAMLEPLLNNPHFNEEDPA
jgi:DNA-binding NarL/FixJ family response regulator